MTLGTLVLLSGCAPAEVERRLNMKLGSMILSLAVGVACSAGGDSAPNPTVSGSVETAAFTARGAVAFRVPIDTCTHDGVTGPVLNLQIVFSDSFDTTYMQSHPCDRKAGSRGFAAFIWNYVASGDIAPGTYSRRDDSTGGQVVFQVKSDVGCNQQLPNLLSDSGSVTIETNDGAHVAGTLDVTFPGGGRLSGPFDAPVVPSPWSVCESFGLPGGSHGPGCLTRACVP